MPASSEASQGKSKLPEPSETMVTPDKKIQVPTGSTGSSARRILFNNLAHKDQEPAGQAGVDGEEVQSKQRPLHHSCAVLSPVSSAAPQDIRAAARSLFGICPSSEKMGQYFQAAELQVREAFRQRWSLDPCNERSVENGRWQWTVRLPGGAVQPLS